MSPYDYWALMFVVSLTAFFGGFICGCLVVRSDFIEEAVKEKAIEYYLDENNVRRWRWTTAPPPNSKERSDEQD